MADVLTYVLTYEGAFNKNSLGAVSEGAKQATATGGECHAVVVGGDDLTDELCATLGRYGAAKVFRAKGPEGLAQPVVDVMAKVIDDNGESYALFGGGLLGFEIGAGLAARKQAGVTMEVVAIKDDGGKLVAERPILQDSKISDSHYQGDLGIIIGRINAFEVADDGDQAHPAEVVDVAVDYSPFNEQITMVTRGEQRGADVDIEGADILVAGGRGLGKAEGFELAENLAKAFGGNSAVAATRAVVDAGWYPYAAQIGQTGKTVSPKLYLAAGISGAIQHKVGMQSSENIVAINKDANAPIFEFSDLGIVGDLNKIMPKLTDAIAGQEGQLKEPVMASSNGHHHAPSEFPPPVDSVKEFIKHGIDGEDERIDVGVAIVGGGTAGLACANRLLQLLAEDPELMESLGEVPVAVIEKAKTCGGHNLSGAVMRPGPLQELFPDLSREDWRQERFAFGEVTKESIYALPTAFTKIPVPSFAVPNFKNHGNEVVSVAALARYQQAQAEEGGAYVLTETAATQLIVEDGAVVGVRSGDKGRGKDGQELSNFEPGTDIGAKVTVLAEGCWGHLTGAAIKQFSLGDHREPQIWELGVKELWKVPKPLDRVIHTLGPWPLKMSRPGTAMSAAAGSIR